ncbi:MAG: hypothetical protein V4691_05820 [Pseudomonadota bacterium]
MPIKTIDQAQTASIVGDDGVIKGNEFKKLLTARFGAGNVNHSSVTNTDYVDFKIIDKMFSEGSIGQAEYDNYKEVAGKVKNRQGTIGPYLSIRDLEQMYPQGIDQAAQAKFGLTPKTAQKNETTGTTTTEAVKVPATTEQEKKTANAVLEEYSGQIDRDLAKHQNLTAKEDVDATTALNGAKALISPAKEGVRTDKIDKNAARGLYTALFSTHKLQIDGKDISGDKMVSIWKSIDFKGGTITLADFNQQVEKQLKGATPSVEKNTTTLKPSVTTKTPEAAQKTYDESVAKIRQSEIYKKNVDAFASNFEKSTNDSSNVIPEISKDILFALGKITKNGNDYVVPEKYQAFLKNVYVGVKLKDFVSIIDDIDKSNTTTASTSSTAESTSNTTVSETNVKSERLTRESVVETVRKSDIYKKNKIFADIFERYVPKDVKILEQDHLRDILVALDKGTYTVENGEEKWRIDQKYRDISMSKSMTLTEITNKVNEIDGNKSITPSAKELAIPALQDLKTRAQKAIDSGKLNSQQIEGAKRAIVDANAAIQALNDGTVNEKHNPTILAAFLKGKVDGDDSETPAIKELALPVLQDLKTRIQQAIASGKLNSQQLEGAKKALAEANAAIQALNDGTVNEKHNPTILAAFLKGKVDGDDTIP